MAVLQKEYGLLINIIGTLKLLWHQLGFFIDPIVAYLGVLFTVCIFFWLCEIYVLTVYYKSLNTDPFLRLLTGETSTLTDEMHCCTMLLSQTVVCGSLYRRGAIMLYCFSAEHAKLLDGMMWWTVLMPWRKSQNENPARHCAAAASKEA